MSYETYQIEPEWVLETEQLGTKDKFWFRCTDEDCPLYDKTEWLFKYPTENTGQHWSEKIAYHVARAMRVFAPQVELAEFEGTQGSATRSFTATHNYELFHGNQILQGIDPSYDEAKRFGQNDHTVDRIFEALGKIFVDAKSGEDARLKMATYLVFDALIGNVDRHHENWGVMRKRTKSGTWEGRFAPSYDHASSLGRELQDRDSKRNREKFLGELGIQSYINKGHGSIFVDGIGKKGPSPIRLIERCLHLEPWQVYFRSAMEKLDNLNKDRLTEIVDLVPADWMSDLSKEFALALILENLKLLYELRTR